MPVNQTVGTSTDCSTVVLADMSQIIVGWRKQIQVEMSRDYAFSSDQMPFGSLRGSTSADQRRHRGDHGSSGDLTMMTREEFVAVVDWAWVRRDVLEPQVRAGTAIAQRSAEILARALQPSLTDQEQFVRWQNNIGACDELIGWIDSLGV
jgi:uncharacterized protein (DUF2461 family)